MGAVFKRFADVLRDGISLFWIAPVIAALVVVPEFIQHVAEINIGMFASKEAFNSLAADPRRMVWGVLKIVGLFLCIMAAARFWGARDRGQKWWDIRGLAWRNFWIAIVLLVITAIPGFVLPSITGKQVSDVVSIVIGIATLPLLALLIAGLIGDRDTGLAAIYRSGWLATLRILVFTAAVWVPLQWLHELNHQWAMGQSAAAVWALMVFDSLVVGALAMLAGTAMHHGYVLRGTKG